MIYKNGKERSKYDLLCEDYSLVDRNLKITEDEIEKLKTDLKRFIEERTNTVRRIQILEENIYTIRHSKVIFLKDLKQTSITLVSLKKSLTLVIDNIARVDSLIKYNTKQLNIHKMNLARIKKELDQFGRLHELSKDKR